MYMSVSSVQSLSHVWLFATPWTVTRQASLSITNSPSLLKLRFIKWEMPSNHLSSSVIPFSSHLQSFPALGTFQWVSSSHQVVKVVEFQLQHHSFQSKHSQQFMWVWIKIYCAYAPLMWRNITMLKNGIYKIQVYSIICICGYAYIFTVLMLPNLGQKEECLWVSFINWKLILYMLKRKGSDLVKHKGVAP